MFGLQCTADGGARGNGEALATSGAMTYRGEAVDPATGRKFFLDFPCDLGADEPVTFILNLHGGGSLGNWQRHYFPLVDFKDSHRLVIAGPTAATQQAFRPGAPPVRMWTAEADDEHLRNIVDLVVGELGAKRIKAFWLAGHSQGGMTSMRLLGAPFFADRVDGFISLSGGRLGRADWAERFGPPKADGSPPDPRPRLPAPALPDADFSFIFTTGEREITALPETSPWAEKYGAGPRVRQADIVDDQAGQIWDFGRCTYPVWGLKAGPGTAEAWRYPSARDGRVIADVVRLGKGHTEGLEPKVTRALLEMMLEEPGGKIASAALAGAQG